MRVSGHGQAGLTLVEMVGGAAVLAMAVVSVLLAFLSQAALNEHSRNLYLAANDASRVLEQIQQQNGAGECTSIDVTPPGAFASWDAWLADTLANGGAGGKSVPRTSAAEELVVVTSTGVDPVEVTIAVCWHHRQRTFGECDWNGAALTPNDADANGIITSPAALSTFITCQG